MASTAYSNGIFEALSVIPKVCSTKKIKKTSKVLSFLGKKDDLQEQLPQMSRRVALGLTSVALFDSTSGIGKILAEDDGFFVIGPIPVPSVKNDIGNKETGTRSFLRNGIYTPDIGQKGRALRLRKYAFDLLAMEDLLGKDAWNYVLKYLRLKGTSMYYDFDNIITGAPVNDKQPLTDLANRLFDSFEKLEDAVRKRNLPETESCYQDTTVILKEVMNRMA